MNKPDRFCSDPTCTRDSFVGGLCKTHWTARFPDKPAPKCIKAGCDRARYARDLCRFHWDEMRADIARQRGTTQPAPTPEPASDQDTSGPLRPVFVHCPDDLLPLVAACVDNDAKAIVRVIWPHFLEACLAGLEPFTLEAVS